ncbi:MAG: beta-N-acetylglucosaminidase domain-containing protein, partial [bacterium]
MSFVKWFLMRRIFNINLIFLFLFFLCAPVFSEQCTVDVSSLIYPFPRYACLSEGVRFSGKVYLSNNDGIESPELVNKFISLFKEYGIEAVEGKAAGGEAAIEFKRGGSEHASVYRQEGYEIVIENKPPLGIQIAARTDAGFYYALQTFRQLLIRRDQEVRIYTGTVRDHPAFSYRGILEGGYDVWDHASRVDILRWMGTLKMNYFIYAPKEGYYFRRRWREPFPPEELEKFREYLNICRDNYIEFSFSLSPAMSMEYSNPKEFDTLVAKFRQIQELGVRHFAIFFDDVLPYLSTP